MSFIEEIIKNLPDKTGAKLTAPASFLLAQRRDTLCVFLFSAGEDRPRAMVKLDNASGAARREEKVISFLRKNGFRPDGHEGDPILMETRMGEAFVVGLKSLKPYQSTGFSHGVFKKSLDEAAGTLARLCGLPPKGFPADEDRRLKDFLLSPRISDVAIRREIGLLLEWRSERIDKDEHGRIAHGDLRIGDLFRCGTLPAILHWENAFIDLPLSDWASFVCSCLTLDFSGRKAGRRFELIKDRLKQAPINDTFKKKTDELMNIVNMPSTESKKVLQWSFLRYLHLEAPRFPEIIEQTGLLLKDLWIS